MSLEIKKMAIAALIIAVFLILLKVVDYHINFKEMIFSSIQYTNVENRTESEHESSQ